MRVPNASIYALAWASVFLLYCAAKSADVCGSDKSGEIQVILNDSFKDHGSVTLFGDNKAPRMTCTVWQITAPQGYSIVLEVLHRHNATVENSETVVFDGNSTSDTSLWNSSATPLHRFIFVFFSSGEQMRVVLKTANISRPVQVYEAYVSVKPTASDCRNNQVINLSATATVAKFTSPYYPLAYPLNVSCVWRIQAPPGKLVRLKFERAMVEEKNIQIYDGEESNQDPLGEYDWDSSFAHVIFSYTESLLIKFKSGSIPRSYIFKGFEMEYSAVEPGCFTNNPAVGFNESFGTISTPGFPSNVPKQATTCIWSFNAPAGHEIKLDLDTITLDPVIHLYPVELQIKYLSAYEKNKHMRYDILLEDKNYTSRSFISSGRRMQLIYNKAASKEPLSLGIIAKYQAIPVALTTGSCAANKTGVINLKGEAATFHSLNYPNNHPGNMDCMWNITVASGQVIELIIPAYNLDPDCDNEYIRIYDGSNNSSPLITKLCKYGYQRNFFSSSNHLSIHYIGKVPSKGLVATYITRKAKPKPYACSSYDSFKSGMQGRLASWGFPLSYPNNAKCDWYIKVPPQYVVNFTLSFFELQPDPSCSKDYLLLLEAGDGWRRVRDIAKICGTNISQVSYLSSSPRMIVEFRSDAIGMYPGFEAKFEAVEKPPEGKRNGGSKVSTVTVVLIVIFSVLGVIGLTILLVWIIKYRYHCCANRSQGNFDMVKMEDDVKT